MSQFQLADNSKDTTSAPYSSDKRAMALLTTLLFMWGFLTVLNDILIPHPKVIFDLNYAEAMLILFSFFFGVLHFFLPLWQVDRAGGI